MQHALLLASHLTTWAIPQTFATRVVTYNPQTIVDHFEKWILDYANHQDQAVPVIKLETQPPTDDRALFIDSDHPFMVCCGSVSRQKEVLAQKRTIP